MVEPLSITAGVVSVLGVCLKVSVELKKFRNEVREVRTTVTAMLTDVKALRQVLGCMEDTFEELESQKPPTGHIGTHWTNLSRTLQDGHTTLESLEELLRKINKDVPFLDQARKRLRLKDAKEQIAHYRQQVQTYKDALQLSLQTIILWNQVSIQDTTARILPNLDAMHQDIRKLATNLNVKLQALQDTSHTNNRRAQIDSVNNLRECIQSAASVLSSASTVLSEEQEDLSPETVDFMSDFGDIFDSPFSQSTLEWVYSTPTNDSPDNLIDTVPRESLFVSNHDLLPCREQIPTNTPNDWSTSQGDRPTTPNNDETTRLSKVGVSLGNLTMLELVPRHTDSIGVAVSTEEKVLSGTAPAPTARQTSSMVNNNYSTMTLSRLLPKETTPSTEEDASSVNALNRTTRQQNVNNQESAITLHRPPPKEKRLSFTRIFLRRPAKPKMRENPATGMRLKAVFVGDGACGKTCFLVRGSKGAMPEGYMPTIFENYLATFDVDGAQIELGLFDTAGQEDYDRLRPLSYPNSTACFICFSIDDPDSVVSVVEKWFPEIRHFMPHVPRFLVGCKKDLRYDAGTIGELMKTGQIPVTPEEGEQLRREIGAIAYFETSAKTGEGIEETFHQSLRIILRDLQRPQQGRRRKLYSR